MEEKQFITLNNLNTQVTQLPLHQDSGAVGTPTILEAQGSSSSGPTGTRKKGKGIEWNLQENISYVAFLTLHEDIFSYSTKELKQLKIHGMMSEKIGTRDSVQCRSHHQKMLKKHKSIRGIIEAMTKELRELKRKEADVRVKAEKEQILINYSEIEWENRDFQVLNGILSPEEVRGTSDGFLF